MFGQQVRYESEFTQFINAFLEKNPDVAQGQIDGRALLWDKAPLDLDERGREAASSVKPKAYPYQAD